MADKKYKRKIKKRVASLSGYNYIDVEGAMLDLRSLTIKLTGKKSNIDELKLDSRDNSFHEEDLNEILKSIKGYH